jgi:hypothetical protein
VTIWESRLLYVFVLADSLLFLIFSPGEIIRRFSCHHQYQTLAARLTPHYILAMSRTSKMTP